MVAEMYVGFLQSQKPILSAEYGLLHPIFLFRFAVFGARAVPATTAQSNSLYKLYTNFLPRNIIQAAHALGACATVN